MKHANLRLFSDCQCDIAYGSRGRPPANWVKMKMVAGQPRNFSGLPGMLQKLFHQLVPLPWGCHSAAGFAAPPTDVAPGRCCSSWRLLKPGTVPFSINIRLSNIHTAGAAPDLGTVSPLGGKAPIVLTV